MLYDIITSSGTIFYSLNNLYSFSSGELAAFTGESLYKTSSMLENVTH